MASPAQRWKRGIAGLLAVMAALGVAGEWGGGASVAFEVFCHFRPHYGVAALGLAALAMARRERLLAGVAAAAGAWALWSSGLGWGMGTKATAGAGEGAWRVLSFNVERGNPRKGEALAFVRRAAPDVAAFLEVDPDWEKALAGLADALPHALTAARPDYHGIALRSRWPLAHARVVPQGHDGLPALVADVATPTGTFTVVAVHGLAPVSQAHFATRNAQLRELAGIARAAADVAPTVMVGDFNLTPFAPAFAALLRASGLRDSRPGFGIGASWPTWLPFAAIPIDHALVSSRLLVKDRVVGEDAGSDHYPLLIDVAPASGP